MPRYFFTITNGKPHTDDTGEELRDDTEAWLAAKRLTRDIEDTLDADGRWRVEVREGAAQVCSITIVAQKHR